MTSRYLPSLSRFTDQGGDSAAIDRAVRRHISALGTPTLVTVTAVYNAGVSLTGTVDVQPMVHQQNAEDKPVPHAEIYGVPYLRIQGGTSAIICDPEVGDIGFIIVSGRDQTNAVANRAPSNAASFRVFDMADCVYVGGFLNAAPQQYIQFTTDGVKIVTPNKVTVQASEVDIQCDLNVSGSVTATGDVKAGNISLESHVHAGVQPGSGTTGSPE